MLVKDIFLIKLPPTSGAALWDSTLKQQLERSRQQDDAFRVHLLPLANPPHGGSMLHQLHLLLPLATLDHDTLLVAEGAGADLLLDYLWEGYHLETLPPLGGVVLGAVADQSTMLDSVSADALKRRASGLPTPMIVLAADSPVGYVVAALRTLLSCFLVTSTGLLLV